MWRGFRLLSYEKWKSFWCEKSKFETLVKVSFSFSFPFPFYTMFKLHFVWYIGKVRKWKVSKYYGRLIHWRFFPFVYFMFMAFLLPEFYVHDLKMLKFMGTNHLKRIAWSEFVLFTFFLKKSKFRNIPFACENYFILILNEESDAVHKLLIQLTLFLIIQ